MWYVKLPSKLCCTHATQLSFISLSQICDSNLGALSAIQPPPSLPQWTCFLQPFVFSCNPYCSPVSLFLPMSSSFPTLCSVLSPFSTLHCLRPSRSSYPVLSPRLPCLTTSLVILAFVPSFSGIRMKMGGLQPCALSDCKRLYLDHQIVLAAGLLLNKASACHSATATRCPTFAHSLPHLNEWYW